MSRPQTIQIFLPDGNPRSIRIADITNQVIQAVLVPRKKLDFMSKRTELQNVGLYFLFGSVEEEGKPVVYIGESENCFKRLKEHHKDPRKEFWNYAVVMVSKINTLTKAHIKYLESVAVAECRSVNRFNCVNGDQPTKSHVTESMEADLLDSFDTMKVLLTTLGYKVFDDVKVKEESEKSDILSINSVGVSATGVYTDEGMIIYKGSESRVKEAASMSSGSKKLKSSLIEKGVLVLKGDKYFFTENYIAGSPSRASDLIVGSSSNGWDTWKNEEGKTLNQLVDRD